MRLTELLTADRVRIPLTSGKKEDVLRELVDLLPAAVDPETGDLIHDAVLERESRMSTGIGQGVAIPHGKSDRVSGMEIAFGIAANPIDFDSLDGEPVAIFFLLVSPPEMAGPHIQALAQISRMLIRGSVREELAGVPDAEAALALFRREEPDPDEET